MQRDLHGIYAGGLRVYVVVMQWLNGEADDAKVAAGIDGSMSYRAATCAPEQTIEATKRGRRIANATDASAVQGLTTDARTNNPV
jgi:hypothetical protein